MNYLAHTYLSLKEKGVVTGNLISDFVKGKKQFDLPPRVLAGVRLHRSIDSFTDSHESTRIIKSFFRPHYRLYAGAFADVVYDHFLARDNSVFPGEKDIHELTAHAYEDLEDHIHHLPPAFLPVFRSMREYNWLALYGNEEALRKSFEGLVRRSRYLIESNTAFNLFMENRDSMKKAYEAFFPALETFSRSALQELLPAE
jgi:acyl carrier protein phosphodiesterase